ncbi:MAG: hypothetical protein WA876_11210 [Candidatus Acidiferrales bacterium]
MDPTTLAAQVDPRLAILAALFGAGNANPGAAVPAGISPTPNGVAPTGMTKGAPQPQPDAGIPATGNGAAPGGMTQPNAAASTPSNPTSPTAASPGKAPADAGSVGALPLGAEALREAMLGRLSGGSQPGAGFPATANGTAVSPAGMTKPQGPTAGGLPLPSGAKTPQSAESTSDTPGVTPLLSEQEYAAKNPGTPTAPYIEPSLKQRMLEGIFAAMMNQGQRGSGTQMENEYLNRIYQGEQQNKTQPAQDAAAAHQRYVSYMEGQKAPLEVQNEQQQLANARAAAGAKPEAPSLDQQYADAIEKGDQGGADKALAAIKNESGAKTRPVVETLAQRYADAVDSGDTGRAEKLLAGLQNMTKATTKPTAPKTPTSEGGMTYADWRRENKNAPVSDYFKLKNQPKDDATQAKNLDDLRKERESVAKDYNAKITAITTSPADAAKLRTEAQDRLAVYDRQIHNFEQGYKEGDIVPYQGHNMKITRILPDGRLQLEPEK